MSKQSFTFAIMKLTDETIGVNQKDLQIFLRLLSAFGESQNNPYLVDGSQTLIDQLFSDTSLKSEFESWSNNQIKFK